jgi:toxin-antitoxin system PIN domain toxin
MPTPAMHLLDVNALIALSWPKHEHHASAERWFSRHARSGWGSCALTQSAFVRITSQPAFGGQSKSIAEAAGVLREILARPSHALVPLNFGFDDVCELCTGSVVGHRQVTDAYLLSAAIRAKMKLLTFDAGIATLLATSEERSAHITLLR